MYKISFNKFRALGALITFLYLQPILADESAIKISLHELNWHVLNYRKTPPNRVRFINQNMEITVEKSAGPVVHRLNRSLRISEFTVKGRVQGVKKVENSTFDEDSELRFGLVASGTKTLSAPQKWIAPDWVKRLFALAPPGAGIDRIFFYNLTNRKKIIGLARVHPKSELISEEISTIISADGHFLMNKKLTPPIDAIAIWLSSDGDDTQSTFTLFLSEIELLKN